MSTPRHRFCSYCGGHLARRLVEGRARDRCRACGAVRYDNPAPAAAALIVRGLREVVLVRRKIAPFRGCWALPAGYQEVDESPADAARREAREETGLEVRVVGLFDLVMTRDDPRKVGLLSVHLCEAVGGRLAPGDDAAEARWHPLEALPAEIGFHTNRAVLERLRREAAAGAVRTLAAFSTAQGERDA